MVLNIRKCVTYIKLINLYLFGFYFPGSDFFSNNCFVICENEIFAAGVDIRIGILTLFALYYCLNILYPSEAAATLEFIQR